MTTITTGARFGSLTVISTDPLGRRVACECICKKLLLVGAGELASGLRTSCGCQPASPLNRAAYQAARLATAREREFAWKKIPERKSYERN